MRVLLNFLKYVSVIVLLTLWFPVQYLFVVGVAQFVLTIVATGFLLAVFLLALTAVGARLGLELKSGFGRWFWVIVPALIALPVELYMTVRGNQHGTYYECPTCGWDLLITPTVDYMPNDPELRILIFSGFIAAVFYGILLASSVFIKFMKRYS